MRLLPTGECWCGCGEEVGLGKFFLPGHDKKAEAEVIRKEYGGVPQFVVQHGYGPLSSRESEIKEMPARYAPEETHPRNTLNDLTAKQWIPETISVWNQQGLGANHPDAKIERLHPAPFSFTDVSRLIRFFTKRGGVVLDPFVGVGSTLKACALEGRKGVGFELNPEYADLSKARLDTEVRDFFGNVSEQVIRTGDARELARDLAGNSIDFIVTSPPYWSILHKRDHKARQERQSHGLDTDYGSDPRDLANIQDYGDFIDQLSAILGDCIRALKLRKYMALIVSDFRDGANYVMFHSDIAAALARRGVDLKGITVLYQRHKRVFPYGYPYAYVPNIHNQFILIMQKTREA